RPGDEAAGAGLGDGDREARGMAARNELGGVGVERREVRHGSGRRTVAVARAAMPSLRPMKPRRSLVVAFTETAPTGTPAIAAMRARIASRCRPIFGASARTVASIWTTVPPSCATRRAA